MELFSNIEAVLLGILQGLGEFLPVSSSGHILLAEKLLGIEVQNAPQEAFLSLFTVFLHLGTLLAVIVVFWKDWMDILRHLFRSKTLGMLILASVPAFLMKLLLKKVEINGVPVDDLLDSGFFLGGFFILTALLLAWAEAIASKRRAGKEKDISWKQAAAMGCMQAVGMYSGISRCGSTIFGGVAAGASKEKAARFSFMMSAPAILGGLLLDGKHFLDTVNEYNELNTLSQLSVSGMLKDNLLCVVLGIAAAAAVGFIAVRVFLKLVSRRNSFMGFSVYLLLLGFAVIALQIAGVLVLPLPVPAA